MDLVDRICFLQIAREVLDAAARVVRPGVTTDEIDAVVHEATIAAGQQWYSFFLVWFYHFMAGFFYFVPLLGAKFSVKNLEKNVLFHLFVVFDWLFSRQYKFHLIPW